MRRRDVALLAIALALVVLPLVLAGARVLPGSGAPGFAGADDQAASLVGKIAPGYRPWVRPIWTPPGGEIASMLFAAQAGLGCAFIGYYFGRRHGRGVREDPGDA